MKAAPTRTRCLSIAALACVLGASVLLLARPGDVALQATRPTVSDSDAREPARPADEPGRREVRKGVAPTAGLEAPLAGRTRSAGTPLTCTLRGRVRTRDGKEPEGLRLRLRTALGKYRRVRIGEDFSFAIPDLVPDSYRMRAELDGYYRRFLRVDVTDDPATHSIEIELVAIPRIRVRLAYPEGERPENWMSVIRKRRPFEVVATRLPLPAFLETSDAGSEEIGHVVWKTADEGLLELEQPTEAWVNVVSHRAVLATRLVPLGLEEVVFELDEHAVRAGCGGVSARFVSLDDDRPVRGKVSLDGNKFDLEDGAVRIPSLTAGRYTMQLWSAGNARWSRRVEVRPGIHLELGTIGVEPAPAIRGRIVGPSAKPVTVEIAEVRGDPRRARWERHSRVSLNSDKRFKFPGRAPGRYLLRARAAKTSASDVLLVDTRSGADQDVRLTLEALAPVSIPGEEAWGKLGRFEVSRVGGLPYWTGALRPETTVVRMLPGENEVVLLTAGRRAGARAVVEVGEAGTELRKDAFTRTR